MAHGEVLVGDWGTTNLRAWRLSETGQVVERREFPFGVSRLQPGEAAVLFETEVRPSLSAQRLPALLCGMIGSTLGWVTAGYIACPTSLEGLATGLTTAASGVRIIPGLSADGLAGPDVMRGEETQVLGWLAADPARGFGQRTLCLPGTHAKWVQLEDGRISGFSTAMTGELYAILNTHSVLRSNSSVFDEAAFDAGLQASGDGGALASRLFSTRGRVLMGSLAPSAAASYLSGLLIGAEVATRQAGEVDLIGESTLCHLYQRALLGREVAATIIDGESCVLDGLRAIWNAAPN